MKKLSIARLVCLLLAAAVFCFSAYQILGIVTENNESKNHYAELADSVVQTVPAPTENATQPEQKITAPIAVDFSKLLLQNGDVVGWIYCEDTPINYPVLKSDDYDDYLRRLMTGERNTAGSIFMDYNSNADLSSLNTILYGHNMRNNTMFGTLKEYNQQAYYEAHPTLWLLTPSGDYKIEVIAGYKTRSDSEAYADIFSQEALQEYIRDILPKSTFQTKADTADIDRVITLSTCVRGEDDYRYVLIGKLISCQ